MTRVFVTGLGMISPAGAGIEPYWDALCAGRPLFGELEPAYPGMKPGVLGGRVPAAAREVARTATGETRTGSMFARYAADAAVADAGLSTTDLSTAIVCVGSSDGQADTLEDVVAGRPAAGGSFGTYSIAGSVADGLGSAGPVFTTQSTCASANVALSAALEMLRDGVADIAVAGGCDPYSAKNAIGFSSIQALGTTGCRPFTTGRRYVTPSEGAGMMVLQTERSLRPGQNPYAELLATAVGNDARHPTAPDRDGVAACHRRALAEAGLTARDVDAIFAHGTGSRANDTIEGDLFAAEYPHAAITAIKGTVGHLMGAAGAAGSVAACLALRHETIPPTAVDAADVAFGIDLVTAGPRKIPGLRVVQSNAFGFGGYNAISLFRSVPR